MTETTFLLQCERWENEVGSGERSRKYNGCQCDKEEAKEFIQGKRKRTHREIYREQRLLLISARLTQNIFRGRAQASIHQLEGGGGGRQDPATERTSKPGRERRGEWFEPAQEPCAGAKANLISSPGVNLVSFVFPIGGKSQG